MRRASCAPLAAEGARSDGGAGGGSNAPSEARSAWSSTGVVGRKISSPDVRPTGRQRNQPLSLAPLPRQSRGASLVGLRPFRTTKPRPEGRHGFLGREERRLTAGNRAEGRIAEVVAPRNSNKVASYWWRCLFTRREHHPRPALFCVPPPSNPTRPRIREFSEYTAFGHAPPVVSPAASSFLLTWSSLRRMRR